MAETSQNGWPVIPNTDDGRSKLENLILPGTMPHAVRVLAGDVATIARWHVAEYHRRVEPIKPAGCWGWNVRKIGNGPDWSNHASATAWDLNAPDNPDGAEPESVMTAAQIATCHALERESDGVLRWGGDWSDPDPMHWEVIGTKQQAAALAARIKEDEMPSVEEIWAYPLEDPYDKSASPRKVSAGGWQRYSPSAAQVAGVGVKVDAVSAKLDALLGRDVDEVAIVAGVLAGLTPELFASAMARAGLTPEALAALIPAELAEEVAQNLAVRLAE